VSSSHISSSALGIAALLVSFGTSGCLTADLLRDRRTLVPSAVQEVAERTWFWTSESSAQRRIALQLSPALRRAIARAVPELPVSDGDLILQPLAHAESLWFVVDRRASVDLSLRVREADPGAQPIVELVVTEVSSLSPALEGYRIVGREPGSFALRYELAIPTRAFYAPRSASEPRSFRLSNVLRIEVVAPMDDDTNDLGKALALPFALAFDVVLSPFEFLAQQRMLKQWRASAGDEANE
jgi:hypothetical protein